ncbi:MAG TPA: hypothetical protein VLM11_12040 [Streptosporangiaceae bacterium]|nr:hypothetical protein [Streptosporangiaceae bacterium]
MAHPCLRGTHLVTRWQDVGEHQGGFVADAAWQPEGRRVGERHTHELGLRPMELVTRDSAAAAEALPVLALAAGPGPAGTLYSLLTPSGGSRRASHGQRLLVPMHRRYT